jgi:hypothetical protein
MWISIASLFDLFSSPPQSSEPDGMIESYSAHPDKEEQIGGNYAIVIFEQ